MDTETTERIKELYELSRLYDLYGALLSDHSREVFEDYILNNFSLSEIADEVGLSRQGVRDIVVRYSSKLRDYEKKLGFLRKIDKAAGELDKLNALIEGSEWDSGTALECVEHIREQFDI